MSSTIVDQSFERHAHSQPSTLELYIQKLDTMNKRTIILYEERFARLLKSSIDQGQELTLKSKIEYAVQSTLEKLKSNQIKSSTFRSYKAALCFGLATTLRKVEEELISDEDLDAGLNLEFLSELYKNLNTVQLHVSNKPDSQNIRTSSKKQKSFPQSFFNYLMEQHTKKNQSARFYLLCKFVKANLVVGLRPIEWLNLCIATNLEHQCLELFVRNSKNSYGRANGLERNLILLNSTKEEELSILDFYTLFQKDLYKKGRQITKESQANLHKDTLIQTESSKTYSILLSDYIPSSKKLIPLNDFFQDEKPQQGLGESILNSLQRELYNAFDNFNKKQGVVDKNQRVTLYSTRHQCIANAKASKLDPYLIAAFFGHSHISTATRHYGRAWSGWSKFKFLPSLESIKAVNNSHKFLKTYLKIEPVSTVDPKPPSTPNLNF